MYLTSWLELKGCREGAGRAGPRVAYTLNLWFNENNHVFMKQTIKVCVSGSVSWDLCALLVQIPTRIQAGRNGREKCFTVLGQLICPLGKSMLFLTWPPDI